jgi:hypothetical protein
MTHSTPTRIRWWEPRWSFVPRELREFQKSFRMRSWLRIIVISAAITGAIAVLANAFIPNLQFNWITAFLISVAAIIGIMVVMPVLVVTFPQLVFVTEKGCGWWWPPLLHDGITYIKRADLKSVTLTIRDDERHVLRFRTNKFCKRIGVARNVKLESLLGMFGDLLIVRDRRHGGTDMQRPTGMEHRRQITMR